MKNIVLDDIRFKLGVREVTGIIHAEQGIPMFYNEEEGIVARLPFPVSAEHYEMPVCVYMRPHTNEIITHLGPDDKIIDELGEDEEDVTNSYEILRSQFDEQKLRRVPRALMATGMCWISAILTIIGGALLYFKILPTWIPVAVLGAVFVGSLIVSRSYTKILNQNIMYDSFGNWINFDTGETSLNNGYTLDVSERK